MRWGLNQNKIRMKKVEFTHILLWLPATTAMTLNLGLAASLCSSGLVLALALTVYTHKRKHKAAVTFLASANRVIKTRIYEKA